MLADIDPAERRARSGERGSVASDREPERVLLVHLYGHMARMDEWLQLCRDRDQLLFEDCAQSHLASWRGRRRAAWEPLGAYSFYPTKNLGAIGDAARCVTRDAALAERARVLRNYGQSVRYHHPARGLNSRLDELQAALLTERLAWLERFTARRRKWPRLTTGDPQSGPHVARHRRRTRRITSTIFTSCCGTSAIVCPTT